MLKLGEYILYRTEKHTIVIAHESGEAMEISEGELAEAVKRLWEERF